MTAVDADGLTAVRKALARHDWQAAHDAAKTASVGTPELEAARADLLGEAAWWLGRLDESIEAREVAYRAYDDLGDRRQAGQCAVWLCEANAISARPDIAGAWLRRARRALEEDPECAEYGALLLREAEAYCKARGAEVLTLQLPADAGEDADVFKESGYQVAGWELERSLK